MSAWFQLENWNAPAQLNSSWNPFSSAWLGKFQLKLITSSRPYNPTCPVISSSYFVHHRVYIYWIIDNFSTLNFKSSLYTCPLYYDQAQYVLLMSKTPLRTIILCMYQRAEQQCAKSTNVISFLCIYPFGDWCS